MFVITLAFDARYDTGFAPSRYCLNVARVLLRSERSFDASSDSFCARACITMNEIHAAHTYRAVLRRVHIALGQRARLEDAATTRATSARAAHWFDLECDPACAELASAMRAVQRPCSTRGDQSARDHVQRNHAFETLQQLLAREVSSAKNEARRTMKQLCSADAALANCMRRRCGVKVREWLAPATPELAQAMIEQLRHAAACCSQTE